MTAIALTGVLLLALLVTGAALATVIGLTPGVVGLIGLAVVGFVVLVSRLRRGV